jgi:hypothetical protein
MDNPFLVHHVPHSKSDIITNLADHLLQYPQDIVDAKRLLRDFQASAGEFHQALLLLDRRSMPQVFI